MTPSLPSDAERRLVRLGIASPIIAPPKPGPWWTGTAAMSMVAAAVVVVIAGAFAVMFR